MMTPYECRCGENFEVELVCNRTFGEFVESLQVSCPKCGATGSKNVKIKVGPDGLIGSTKERPVYVPGPTKKVAKPR